VVIDGCINEVGAYQIALPFPFNSTTKEDVDQRAFKWCSTPMRDAVTKVKSNFSSATVIVLDYYRVVSPASSPVRKVNGTGSNGSSPSELDRVLKEELKLEQSAAGAPATRSLGAPRPQAWPENSAAFFMTSENCFKWAIAGRVPLSNAGSDQDPVCPVTTSMPVQTPDSVKNGDRVFLATVPDKDEYAYGAPKKHLWSLPIRYWFFGFHVARSDDMYKIRWPLCQNHYQDDKDRLVCSVNPIAHPNVQGAKAYACSIIHDPKLPCENASGILDQAWRRP
jgi:hypothetical protein